ncbi:MAG: sigma 54-interacting transcriptional regulator [Candidatus Moduliflexus flocculans]|nr:sigma 54-interacting transcriptional regulator [Candidatus Moduliflexus flocculans]
MLGRRRHPVPGRDRRHEPGVPGQDSARHRRTARCFRWERRAARRWIVRVIAATHHGLEHEVQESRFRADLFYRLNVARVDLPPLRERREDIPLLLAHFARELQPPDARRPAASRAPGDGGADGLRLARQLPRVAQLRRGGIHPRHGGFRHRERSSRLHRERRPARRRTRSARASSRHWCNASGTAARRRGHLRWSRMTLYRKMKRYAITPVPPAAARRGHVPRFPQFPAHEPSASPAAPARRAAPAAVTHVRRVTACGDNPFRGAESGPREK